MKNKVLKALSNAGFKLGLWYDQSARQWIFIGPDTYHWDQTGTHVYRLTDLTPSQWVELAREFKEINA